NITAEFHLGFTEPFSRLEFKFRTLLESSNDLQALGYAVTHLGEGVPASSPLRSVLERNRLQVFSNPTLLNWMNGTKQQQLLSLNAPQAALKRVQGPPSAGLSDWSLLLKIVKPVLDRVECTPAARPIRPVVDFIRTQESHQKLIAANQNWSFIL